MENMIEKIINKNENKYNEFKGELESILKSANSEYNSMLSDYNSQINFIKNDNGYSAEGKSRENKKINDIFSNKVSSKANEYHDKLIAKIDEELNKREKEESESYIDESDENYYSKKILNEITKQHLNGNMMVQLIYVNSMLNSINSIDDADMLDYVYKYACVDKNFSDEIINMIYLKARNIINAPREKKDYSILTKTGHDTEVEGRDIPKEQLDGIKAAQNRSKISKIIEEFNKYNYDYSNDINNFKKSFSTSKSRGHYPGGLYNYIDFKRDFNINIFDAWGNNKKSNDPWNR